MLFKFNITNKWINKRLCQFWGFALLLAIHPIAETHGFSLSSLQNLPGFGVNVNRMTFDAEELGVSQEGLQKLIVDHLKKIDLNVYTEEKLSRAPGKPILELAVLLRKVKDGSGYIFSLRLALQEMVSLERPTDNLAGIYAPTWEKTILGITNKKSYLDMGVRQLLDRFAQEYQAENL